MNSEYFKIVLYPEKIEEKLKEAIVSFSKKEQKTIEKALTFATKKHHAQQRDEGTPYISHCVLAALIAYENKGNADDIVTLLLHDTIEDTETSYDEIAELFGTEVADNVRALSHTEGGARMSVEDYQKRLLARPACLFHKSCDRIANLYSTYVQPKRSKKQRMIKGTEEFFYPMLEEKYPKMVQHMKDIIVYIKAHAIITKPFKARIKELQNLSIS
ncbi:MAG: HD domain-containing protein [Candidatus Gracilibacteria bacterium]